MAQPTMRGMRLGAQSLESEIGIAYSERTNYKYKCAKSHLTEVFFSADAEAPETWTCKACSNTAVLLAADGSVINEAPVEKIARTHYEMLLERRSREELEELLAERLAALRVRRAKGKADKDS
jgi:hypothetical protein